MIAKRVQAKGSTGGWRIQFAFLYDGLASCIHASAQNICSKLLQECAPINTSLFYLESNVLQLTRSSDY